MKLGTGLKMEDKKHTGYSLAEILDPSRITRLSFPCEPAPEELEAFHKLFMNMDMRTCDGKTVDAYLKELKELAHAPSKDGDDAMASILMLDSLGPLMEKNNVKKNP